ncbi:MAG TPA: TlpA disulfide reductase family protein [Fimbriimonadaceae bacterium]|nr:TlpA disulfide reductase family protein [Fimbriimonadaceae bacterium]
MKGRRWLAGALLAAVAMTMIQTRPRTVEVGPPPPPGSRRSAPEIGGTLLDGRTWRASDHRGKVVLINYWATWCAPCRREAPVLNRLYRRLGDQVVFVGLAVDSSERAVQGFVHSYSLQYPVGQASASVGLELHAIPTTIMLDRAGRVAARVVGELDEPSLESLLRALLEE